MDKPLMRTFQNPQSYTSSAGVLAVVPPAGMGLTPDGEPGQLWSYLVYGLVAICLCRRGLLSVPHHRAAHSCARGEAARAPHPCVLRAVLARPRLPPHRNPHDFLDRLPAGGIGDTRERAESHRDHPRLQRGRHGPAVDRVGGQSRLSARSAGNSGSRRWQQGRHVELHLPGRGALSRSRHRPSVRSATEASARRSLWASAAPAGRSW